MSDLTLSTGIELTPRDPDWHDRGGLVGRGVLVDYKAYVDAKAIPFSPFDPYAITVQDIEAVLRSQGTSIKEGDIFILRTGYTEVLGQSTPEEQARLMGLGTSAGIMPTEDLARWFWNQHISAVASDNYAFEARLGDGKRASKWHQSLNSHEQADAYAKSYINTSLVCLASTLASSGTFEHYPNNVHRQRGTHSS